MRIHYDIAALERMNPARQWWRRLRSGQAESNENGDEAMIITAPGRPNPDLAPSNISFQVEAD